MRPALIVPGWFWLVGRKLYAFAALALFALVTLTVVTTWYSKPWVRRLRRNVRALRLAFQARQVTKELRATKLRIETEALKVGFHADSR